MNKTVGANLTLQYSHLGVTAVLLLLFTATACGKGSAHAAPAKRRGQIYWPRNGRAKQL